MRAPDRSGEAREQLSPRARRRVMRAAFLRPMSLLMVVIGTVSFAFTQTWWFIPLTLATYASLVFLAVRDPSFRARVLEGREGRSGAWPRSPGRQDVSPEQRVRRLPRSETRQKMEEALEIHRRTVFVIEESDDVTRAVLNDLAPKLRRVIEYLVDIAEKREKAARSTRDLKPHASSTSTEHREGRGAGPEELEKELYTADVEISDTLEKLSALRARVVRVSAESGGAAQEAAARLNADLDELNLHLDALRSRMSPPGPPDL